MVFLWCMGVCVCDIEELIAGDQKTTGRMRRGIWTTLWQRDPKENKNWRNETSHRLFWESFNNMV